MLVFALVAVGFACVWWIVERHRSARPGRMTATDLAVGFGTNFFDALGIGNFAPTTAVFKLTRRMPDEEIPGTLNVGHTLPVLVSAVIFTASVTVDFRTLATMLPPYWARGSGRGGWPGGRAVRYNSEWVLPFCWLRCSSSRPICVGFTAAAIGLTIGGIPGVLAAVDVVKSLPLFWLRWLVVIVVLYTSIVMLRSAYVTRARASSKRFIPDVR